PIQPWPKPPAVVGFHLRSSTCAGSTSARTITHRHCSYGPTNTSPGAAGSRQPILLMSFSTVSSTDPLHRHHADQHHPGHPRRGRVCVRFVPEGGLEPPRPIRALAPQASASAIPPLGLVLRRTGTGEAHAT